MAAETDSILAAARQLNQARFALNDALAAVVAQLPEDAQAEFGGDEVEGFDFNPGLGFDRNLLATQGLRRFGGQGVAFFDTNGSCGAVRSEFGEEVV